MNRKAGLNLLLNAASEAVQQWSREIQGMRMGLLIVAHKGEWKSGVMEYWVEGSASREVLLYLSTILPVFQRSTIPFLQFPWSVMPACSAIGGRKGI